MNDMYICKLDNCRNKSENKGNICCYSCDVKGCENRCDEDFEDCEGKFKIEKIKHELKILPEYFYDVLSSRKRFEIRKNDRNFKVGDTVKLREFKDGIYTGNYINARITYVFLGGQYGLEEGYCIFSFRVYASGKEEIK